MSFWVRLCLQISEGQLTLQPQFSKKFKESHGFQFIQPFLVLTIEVITSKLFPHWNWNPLSTVFTIQMSLFSGKSLACLKSPYQSCTIWEWKWGHLLTSVNKGRRELGPNILLFKEENWSSVRGRELIENTQWNPSILVFETSLKWYDFWGYLKADFQRIIHWRWNVQHA